MPRWRYRVIDLNDLPPRFGEVDVLNAAGEDGWVLVAITGNRIAHLKRPIDDAARPPEAPASSRSGRRKSAPRVE